MMQRAYLCVILHVKHRKLSFIAILTQFLILVEIQDGVTSLQQPHHPLKINLILLSRSKAFHCRKNRFEIPQIIKNSGEGFHICCSHLL